MHPSLAFKILLFTLLVPGAFILYIPYSIVAEANGGFRPVNPLPAIPAILLFLAGFGIYLRCAWDFAVDGAGTPAPIDPPRKLIVRGLYRRNRNPMYSGVFLALLAECLFFRDIHLWLYASGFIAIINIFVIYYEEPALRKKFGNAYLDYCRQVPRWLFWPRTGDPRHG